MNTVQNGKGDSPRNNWGPKWYDGYTAIDWHREPQRSGDSAKEPMDTDVRTSEGLEQVAS
jgi:hypothetical protein